MTQMPTQPAGHPAATIEPDVTATRATPTTAWQTPTPAVRRHSVGRVLILEVAGRLPDVLEDLNLAIRFALAGEPRGVICDLTAIEDVNATGALRGLATAGRHPRDRPDVPLVIAGLPPAAGEALRRKPLGEYLVLSETTLTAVASALLASRTTVE
jgi:hypothetical protein